jgi:hypothetical protein
MFPFGEVNNLGGGPGVELTLLSDRYSRRGAEERYFLVYIPQAIKGKGFSFLL